jgi:hypothetical protein
LEFATWLPDCFFVILHVSPRGQSHLPAILARTERHASTRAKRMAKTMKVQSLTNAVEAKEIKSVNVNEAAGRIIPAHKRDGAVEVTAPVLHRAFPIKWLECDRHFEHGTA